MATGVSGTIEFQSRDYDPSRYRGGRFRLSYSETYDIAGNYSDITFSNFQVAGISNYGRVVLSGILTANGTEIFNKNNVDIGLYSTGDDTFRSMKDAALGLPKTIRVQHDSDGKKTIVLAVAKVAAFDYFNVYFVSSATGTSYSESQSLVLTNIPRGLVKIHNGTSFENYSIQIYNGSSWDRYTPYVYNGTSWEPYNGG